MALERWMKTHERPVDGGGAPPAQSPVCPPTAPLADLSATRQTDPAPDTMPVKAGDPPSPPTPCAEGQGQGVLPIEHTLASVKVPFTATEPTVDQIVTWDSPLFGLLSGVILAVSDQSVTVLHPLSEQEATIPKAWCKWWISPETIKAIQRRYAGGDPHPADDPSPQ